ncbi:hypothetical protein [Pimelobacter simplex]|uniref:hypothetical protein n=1 Tax=Nocardioides simplex TaxID=2045 RepID=UPI003AABE049
MLRRGLLHTLALVSLIIAASACSSTPDGEPPTRFTIRPDDYHVPYAGTAADGRRFFLSEELGTPEDPDTWYVGLFLWHPDGTFDEVVAERVATVPASDRLRETYLASLGDYVLEPVEVTPFTTEIDGITFGWAVSEYEGIWSINIEPGDFIAYNEPWDGVDYDT